MTPRNLLLVAVVVMMPVERAEKLARDEGCNVYCVQSGYDSGSYSRGECCCKDFFSYAIAKTKRVVLPRRRRLNTRD